MPQTFRLFVPGRLCLAGEHSDWAGTYRQTHPSISPGAALVVGLQQGLHASVSPSKQLLHLSSHLAGDATIAPESLLKTAQTSSPWRFATAAAYLIRERYNATGATIHITNSTLPAARGLSSSAAVCVLTVRAFNNLHALRLSIAGEMDLAYAAERLTGSLCGRLDQVVAIGPGNVASMSFNAEHVQYSLLRPKSPVHVVVADLAVGKDTKQILTALQTAFPVPVSDMHKKLHAALGSDNLRLVTEMENAILEGDARRLGTLFVEAQRTFDKAAIPLCPSQLEAPVLHDTLQHPDILPLSYGGKGVGSQGDGAVQFVARDFESAKSIVSILTDHLATEPQIVSIGSETNPTQHATSKPKLTERNNSVRTAVIPAAGFGTRLFPASRSIRPKALFPVVDTDGFAKPLILHLVEQCANAGIERIIIVVGPGDHEDRIREVFSPVSKGLFTALKPHMQAYATKIAELGHLIEIDVQEVPNGFGDAVACANVDPDEPFVLLLGDVVFRVPDAADSCLQQTMDAFEQDTSRGVIGVTQVPIQEAGPYGVVCTEESVTTECSLMRIRNIVEKPDRNEAEQLSRNGECSIILGPYVFTPLLMKELRADVQAGRTAGGEIQLTPAINRVIEQEGMFAARLEGDVLDTGNAAEYTRTIAKLGNVC